MATADSVANPHQREGQLVSGGVYTIHPHHSENNCFCVEEDASARYVLNLRPVHLQSLKQRFIAQQHTDGTWSFRSKELQGAHALDSLGPNKKKVCIMSPFDEGGNTNQQFHIRPVEEGGPWVTIRASWDNNFCLDIDQRGHEGASVVMWNVIDVRYRRAQHQEFRFHRATDSVANPHQREEQLVSGGVYIIRPHHSEDNCFCVEDVDKSYVLKLRPVHLQLPEQRFIAEQHTQHGTWSFRSKALRKSHALDSLGSDKAVCIMSPYDEGGNVNQQFHIRPVEEGCPWVNIRATWNNNVCLSVNDEEHEGASVNTWGFIDDLHQEFCFDRVLE